MAWQAQQTPSGYLLHDRKLARLLEPWMLDAGALAERGLVRGQGGDGRGQVLFYDSPVLGAAGQWVLRHYLRGGAVAKLLDDRYLWLGLQRSRPWREFGLIAAMHGQGLPVPRPLAARISRAGVFYRADLVTLRIPDARPLDALLQEGGVPAQTWRRVGGCIRRFHDAGYHHADLNSRNILVDSGERVWVLDWDRGLRRQPGAWGEANLARLRRDLEKRLRMYARWHYAEADFRELRKGYGLPGTPHRKGRGQ